MDPTGFVRPISTGRCIMATGCRVIDRQSAPRREYHKVLKYCFKYKFINVIELHSKVWHSLPARREHLPHALFLPGRRAWANSISPRQVCTALLCETPTADGAACGQCLPQLVCPGESLPEFPFVQAEAMAEEGVEEGKKGQSANHHGPGARP